MGGAGDLEKFLKALDSYSSRVPDIPLVVLTYANPLMMAGGSQKGILGGLEMLAQAGAKGVIIPDLTIEGMEPLLYGEYQNMKTLGLETVPLCTPNTPLDRQKQIAKAAQGFIYLVSVTGTTGVRVAGGFDERVPKVIANLKSVTDAPVAVGFGISSPDSAKAVANLGADGVIMGSQIIKMLSEVQGAGDATAVNIKKATKSVVELSNSIVDALKSPQPED